MSDLGTCEKCAGQFRYQIIHNGFSDTAYAYCDRCGCTAIISGWSPRPADAPFKVHQSISADVEPFLKPCSCGGHFRAGAAPRCPECNSALSADAATSYIEVNAPGTAKGWRWQRDWVGVYCIVVDGRRMDDPWRPELLPSDG